MLATGSDRNAQAARVIALVGAVLGLRGDAAALHAASTRRRAASSSSSSKPWIETFNVNYHLGIDGISLLLILLNSFTTVLVVIAGWEVIKERVAQYMAAFLFLSGFMNGVFCALDALLFYVFFEATLIPMFVIIGVWGGPNRVYAAVKFFLYTLPGRCSRWSRSSTSTTSPDGSFSLLDYYRLPLALGAQILIFLAFFVAFAVKVPMWPVHTWLPDAHVEAPTGGSVVLAAIMLKLGGYGFLRLSLPIVPDASHALAGFVIALSLIAVVYIGLVALVQADMKKLIAYSSISHMGFVTLGHLHLQRAGHRGRGHPDDLARLRLGRAVPVRGRALRPHALAPDRRLRRRGQHACRCSRRSSCCSRWPTRGCPGTSGFVGEFLVILGAMQGELLVRGGGRHDAHLRRGLHAVDVQARDLRRGRERARGGADGHRRARAPGAGAAGGGGARDGDLSRARSPRCCTPRSRICSPTSRRPSSKLP